jgi:hypothetical protein
MDVAAAMRFFDAYMRPIMKLIGIKKVLRVRRATVAKNVGPLIERTA